MADRSEDHPLPRNIRQRRLLLPSSTVTASPCIDTADALIAAHLLSRSNPSFRHQPAAAVDDFVDVAPESAGFDGDSASGANRRRGGRRITHLRLCDYTAATTAGGPDARSPPSWALDPCVGRLDQLQRLDVKKCRSLPEELSTLQRLEFLFLDCCPELTDLPEGDVPATKTVYLSGTWSEASLGRFVPWATEHLVNLTTFRCTHLEDPPVHPALSDGFRVGGTVCRNLRTVDLKYCGLRQDALEGLLFDSLLPNADRYPHLTVLDLANNDIDSLQSVAVRIRALSSNSSERHETNNVTSPLRLRQLILTRNSVMERTDTPEEHSALTTLLKYFQELGCLGFPRWDGTGGGGGNSCCGRGRKRLKIWHPELEYWLRINRCGRVLVEGRDAAPSRDRRRPAGRGLDTDGQIALSVWPRVLERAHETANEGVFQEQLYSGDDGSSYSVNRATGLFYLLRHKPDLVPSRHGPSAAKRS